MKKLSIGTWAYVFNQPTPTDFHTILHKLSDLGMDGLELGAFKPHPNPADCDSRAKRQQLKKEVHDHGLEFSGLAADLWKHKLISVADSGPYIADFARNLVFAEDLGIDLIRVDTLEPPDVFARTGTEPKLGRQRLVKAWDLCARLAADRGIRVAWEFEPGFAFNKPAEIVGIVDEVRGLGNPNFGVMVDTCHAHMCAAVGALQPGEKETLPGGAVEILHQLKGRVIHLHLIDSDGTLNDHHTSTHVPFGQGVLDWDQLIPELLKAEVPSPWWCIDLCFWPDAWTVTADAKRFLDKLRRKYAA